MGLPFSLDLVLVTSGFVLLGNLWSKQVQSFQFQWHKLVIAMIIFLAFHKFSNETIDFNNRLFGNFFICTLQSLLGIYITISFSSFLSRFQITSRLLGIVGASSLFIMMFHWVVMDAVMLFIRLSRYEKVNTFIAIIAAIAIPVLLQNASKLRKTS
jgi:polysaccharide biosynthesis protein PslL